MLETTGDVSIGSSAITHIGHTKIKGAIAPIGVGTQGYLNARLHGVLTPRVHAAIQVGFVPSPTARRELAAMASYCKEYKEGMTAWQYFSQSEYDLVKRRVGYDRVNKWKSLRLISFCVTLAMRHGKGDGGATKLDKRGFAPVKNPLKLKVVEVLEDDGLGVWPGDYKVNA